MKKWIVIGCVLISLYLSTSRIEEVVIPEESIRFRIIASSNSLEDQLEKMTLKKDIQKELATRIDASSLQSARTSIQEAMPLMKEILEERVSQYEIRYGFNLFPEKNYKGVTYKSGNYESLVITLGEGLGDNYWCVLYPPLCTIDDTKSEVEYKWLVKEIIDKL